MEYNVLQVGIRFNGAYLLLCFVADINVNLYSELIFLFFCVLEINHLENNLKIIVKKLVYIIYMIYICIS